MKKLWWPLLSTTANTDKSELEGADLDEEEESEEEVEESGWVSEVNFPADLVLDEYKTQSRRVMKSYEEILWRKILLKKNCHQSSWIISSFKRCSLSAFILISKQ